MREMDRAMTSVSMDLLDVPIRNDYDGTRFKVNIVLFYWEEDPYAVTMSIYEKTTQQAHDWTMGRDLFAAAIRGERPPKHADVKIVAAIDAIEVSLSSPTGRATLFFEPEDIAEFLRNSFDLVGPGEENVDAKIDEISHFLARWPNV